MCMEEIVIVHNRLNRKSVEKCQFSGVCVEGRIIMFIEPCIILIVE